jgi:SnoaL-like domain
MLTACFELEGGLMSNPLGHLMERNLLEVFGQRDSERRKVAVSELYTEDCTFFEAEERVVGREVLNEKVERILQDAPGFMFRLVGSPQVNHDHGRLQWQFGPNGAAPVVTGMDIVVFERGRIRALYTFLDNVPSYENQKGQNRVKHTDQTAADGGQVRK